MNSKQHARWLQLIFLCGLLLWLRIEDVKLHWPTLLACGMVYLFWNGKRPVSYTLAQRVSLGMLSGMMVGVLALLLIVFKSGLHAHGFFELPKGMLVQLGLISLGLLLIGGLLGMIASSKG